MVWLAISALITAISSCGFPEYRFPVGTSGSGGVAGSETPPGGAGGSSGGTGGGHEDGGHEDGGAEEAGAGGAADAGGGAGGQAGGAGESGAPCVFPTPVAYPGHCFNRVVDEGESGTDCGGSVCAPCSNNQACTQPSDCLSQQCSTSKSCVPLISLGYTAIDVSAQTPSPKFKLSITYLDTIKMPLRDFSIRYYYNHSNVTEPIIGLDSQATIDPGNSQSDISKLMRTSVHRFPPGPVQNGVSTDSYLEIGFDDPMFVIQGTKFVINQDFIAGSSDVLFDQNGHYSFMKSTIPVSNETITVHRAGQRLWGTPPPLAEFPECAFAFGVNLNGPSLLVGGEALLAESEANFTFTGSPAYTNTAALLPTTDANTARLLGTGRTLITGDSALWPVPKGRYWAYAWLTSTVNSDNGKLSIGGSPADKFFGKNLGSARWGLIGPYAVDVLDGSLSLTVEGNVHVAGVKLFAAASTREPLSQTR